MVDRPHHTHTRAILLLLVLGKVVGGFSAFIFQTFQTCAYTSGTPLLLPASEIEREPLQIVKRRNL